MRRRKFCTDQLRRLRDEILTPDKDRIKAEKNRLLQRVHELNIDAGRLRDYKAEIRSKELTTGHGRPLQIQPPLISATVKRFDKAKGYGFVSTPQGDSRALLPERELWDDGERIEVSVPVDQPGGVSAGGRPYRGDDRRQQCSGQLSGKHVGYARDLQSSKPTGALLAFVIGE